MQSGYDLVISYGSPDRIGHHGYSYGRQDVRGMEFTAQEWEYNCKLHLEMIDVWKVFEEGMWNELWLWTEVVGIRIHMEDARTV